MLSIEFIYYIFLVYMFIMLSLFKFILYKDYLDKAIYENRYFSYFRLVIWALLVFKRCHYSVIVYFFILNTKFKQFIIWSI
jgi:hypothetical protein